MRSGVTLTELLISLAVFTALLSLAGAAHHRVQSRADDAAAIACASAISRAQEQQHTDTGTYASTLNSIASELSGSCRSMTPLLTGRTTPARYVAMVYHPRGNFSYTVTPGGLTKTGSTVSSAGNNQQPAPETLNFYGGVTGCGYTYSDPTVTSTVQMPCGNDHVEYLPYSAGSRTISFSARADAYEGWPNARITQGSVTLANVTVDSNTWRTFSTATPVSIQSRVPIRITFTNDHCCGPTGTPNRDRNLYLGSLTLTP